MYALRKEFQAPTYALRKEVKAPTYAPTVGSYHTVGYAGFAHPEIGEVRDQICTTQGPEVSYVRQVDF